MGIFYMDTEYTNGNFYLGDIFEIAVLSESSGCIFHSYINIATTIPEYVQRLCNVTDVTNSPSFPNVMNNLIRFINQEDVTIIAHGGYLVIFLFYSPTV